MTSAHGTALVVDPRLGTTGLGGTRRGALLVARKAGTMSKGWYCRGVRIVGAGRNDLGVALPRIRAGLDISDRVS